MLLLLPLLLLVIDCLFTFVAEMQKRAIAMQFPCRCIVRPRRFCIVAEAPEITPLPKVPYLRLPFAACFAPAHAF